MAAVEEKTGAEILTPVYSAASAAKAAAVAGCRHGLEIIAIFQWHMSSLFYSEWRVRHASNVRPLPSEGSGQGRRRSLAHGARRRGVYLGEGKRYAL
jgi:hypothetical protein